MFVALKNIRDKFQTNYSTGVPPILNDHGVPKNVLRRITGTEFRQFYDQCLIALGLANSAYNAATPEDSLKYWKQLFGEEFDPQPSGSGKGGFSKPSGTPDNVNSGRFG